MSPTYDPEKEKTNVPGSHDDLGVHPERREADIDQLERNYSAPAAKKTSHAERQEADGLNDATGGFFKDGGKQKPGLRKRAKGFFGGNKKKFWAGGLGAGALLLVVGLIIMFVSFLTIPHFAEQITSYQFARSARAFRKSMSQLTSERVWMESLSDNEYEAQKSRYSRLRDATWGRLDKYRPNQVFQNMRAQGQINFDYGPPTRVLGRNQVTAVFIDGERIPLDDGLNDGRIGTRIFNGRNQRIRFSAQLDANIDQALRGHKSLVRSRVAKKIRGDLGIKLSFWEKNGAKYRNLSADEADRLLARETYARSKALPEGSSLVQDLDKTADETSKAVDDAVADDNQLDDILRSQGDDLGDAVEEAADGFGSSVASRAVTWFSTTYAVAEPLCIIYEGSVERSEGVVDARSQSLQTEYYNLATAADQQKAGDTTGDAIGAYQRKLQTTGNSPVEKRSRGEAPNAEFVPLSPQSSGIGTYSVLNALFGNDNDVIEATNDAADLVCPRLTNVWVGAGAGAAEILAAIFTGGSSKLGQEGVKLTVRQTLRELASNFVGRQAVKRYVRNGAATGGLTLISRLLVVARAGMEYNGLAMSDDAVTNADMGGDLNAQEVNRQQFYGRPLRAPEIVQGHSSDMTYLAQKRGERSWYDRYLNPKQYDSFATTFASSLRGRFSSLFSSGSILNPAAILGGAYDNFSSSAHAATIDEANPYKIVQWGWTAEEEAKLENDPSYLPLNNQLILQQEFGLQKAEDMYGDCFTKTMGQLLEEGKIQRDKDGNVNDEGDCAPSNLGINNEMAFRYRVAMRNNATLDHLTDIQEPTSGESTSEEPLDGLPEGVVTEADTAVTKGGGGIRVHKSIVDKVDEMLAAAAADGVQLTGGGWRSPEAQIELRKAHCGTSHYDIYEKPASECSPPTARPGTSNHEKGLAIDFDNCKTRSTACYGWLAANAERFGFFNLPSEPWHWSVDGK